MSNSAAIEPPQSVREPSAAPQTAPVPTPRSGLHVRFFSLLTLCAIAVGFAYLAMTAYQAVVDSFVAPAILSPDSDAVMAAKLKWSELTVERARAQAELEGIQADLTAGEKTIRSLQDLHHHAEGAAHWTSEVTFQKSESNASELKALADQRKVLQSMLDAQTDLLSKAEADVDAGVISRTDYAKEEQTLRQLELALLENERSTVQSQSAMNETQLAQRALARAAGAPAMPELIARDEQLVRVELETVRLESEKRSKLAERRAVMERLTAIDELETQLRSRPFFQAATHNVEVAFVPYTQSSGVEPGASVYSCLWGIFACRPVGTVAQLVPGEVVLPDPWGNQARGQYAVLDLRDHEAAKSKTLRVRRAASAATAALSGTAVSAR